MIEKQPAAADGIDTTPRPVIHSRSPTGLHGASATVMQATWRRIRRSRLRDYGLLAGFFGLFAALSLGSASFLTTQNWANLLDQSVEVGLVACGMTLVIIAGGFDLSVGSTFAVAGVVAAMVTNSLHSTPIGVLAGLGAGAALGLVNALLITVCRINSFIATLASSIIFSGVGLLLTGGNVVSVQLSSFQTLGESGALGLYWSVWIFAAFALACGFALARTLFGRYLYAVGGNREAARLSGLRVDVIRGATFVVSGISAGLAGILVASQVSSAQSDAGANLDLSAIAAAVIGGTSIAGGEGAIWRTVVGVVFLTMITDGSNLLNISPTWAMILQGVIIIVAVTVDAWSKRRR